MPAHISFTEFEKYERQMEQSQSGSQRSRSEVSLLLASYVLDTKSHVVLSRLRCDSVICFDRDSE